MCEALLVAVVFLVAACSSSGGVTAPPQPSSSVPAASAAAHVGDTVTLATGGTGRMEATVMKVQTVHPTRTLDRLQRGDKWVGVQLRLAAAGSPVDGEGPFISTTVLDRQGQSYDPAAVEALREGPAMPGRPHVSAGSSVLGWLVFQVPASVAVARVQYAATGGLGDTGEWLVP